jgi:hypothetical protein
VEVEFHPEARGELLALPEREQAAIKGAIAKLVARGPALGFPYSSAVRGEADGARCTGRSGR